MALTPQSTTNSEHVDRAFLADRALFWGRFTKFVKGGIIALIVLLVGLMLFVY